MRKDIQEIKQTIDNCWKSLDKIIQLELENIDKQMNELIIKKLHTEDPIEKRKIEKQLQKLNDNYIEMFLSKSEERERENEVKKDYEELFGDNNK